METRSKPEIDLTLWFLENNIIIMPNSFFFFFSEYINDGLIDRCYLASHARLLLVNETETKESCSATKPSLSLSLFLSLNQSWHEPKPCVRSSSNAPATTTWSPSKPKTTPTPSPSFSKAPVPSVLSLSFFFSISSIFLHCFVFCLDVWFLESSELSWNLSGKLWKFLCFVYVTVRFDLDGHMFCYPAVFSFWNCWFFVKPMELYCLDLRIYGLEVLLNN